ncbi:hypothetical protein [Azospirillum agricola]|uniref:hypothetical protein n=1 Tax=Azospirillum agricola TaxID=1720247 RepID=UPI000A0F0D22|nr:hypothetical protein [Azospirillum agricola]SMH48117.1 hypothetical protein SAMN02982994_2746 [Azospirillum lipoferum]
MTMPGRNPDPRVGAVPGASADRLPTLEHKLLDIPAHKFVEVVGLLERVRDHPDVRQTFNIIRPRLAQIRPGRRPTLKRVLCMPFEDVLESRHGGDAPLGRIGRRVIEPIWGLIAEVADRHQIAQLDRQVQEASPGSRNALLNVGRVLWPLAARILRDALDGAASRPALARRLDGDGKLLEQVADIAAFLDIGPAVEALKDELSPKPLPALEERHLAAIGRAAQTVAPDAVRHLLLIAAARLATPADLLAALPDLDLGRAGRDRPGLFAQLGALVVGDLEERSARLDGAGGVAPEAAVIVAERLVASVTTAAAAMSRLRDPRHRERLEAVTTAVAAMVRGSVLQTAPEGILAAVPVADRRQAPVVDEAAQATAEEHARALRRCAGLAGALGLQKPVDDTLAAMGAGLQQRAQALLDGHRWTAGRPDEAEASELNLFYALRLLELVGGPARAEPLRLAIMDAIGGFTGD